jgi:hypothetical protein
MLALLITLNICTTLKRKQHQRDSKKKSNIAGMKQKTIQFKDCTEPDDLEDSDKCYDAYVKAAAGLADDSRKNFEKPIKGKAALTTEQAALVKKFQDECEVTACKKACAGTLDTITDQSTAPSQDDLDEFAENCEVKEPSSGGGDSGMISTSGSKIIYLILLLGMVLSFKD